MTTDNKLDRYCRNAQDQQTIGLPVGPDTSRVIGELVASAVDERLREETGVTSHDASRYIDNFTISSASGLSEFIFFWRTDGVVASATLAGDGTYTFYGRRSRRTEVLKEGLSLAQPLPPKVVSVLSGTGRQEQGALA